MVFWLSVFLCLYLTMRSINYSLAHINQVALQLIAEAGDKRIWLLNGDMGAGKTTLIKAICKQLGAVGDFSSPTYSLVNEYPLTIGGKVYHLDLYRLKNIGEALDIGVEEYLYSGNYCFIEWSQLIHPLLHQGKYLTLQIDTIDEEQRLIQIL